MRPAGPVAALAAGVLALGAVAPERVADVHVTLLSVSAQPAPRTDGVPPVLRRDRRSRWQIGYTVAGQTTRPFGSFARFTLQRGATRWRFRSARVTERGMTTWEYRAAVPRWFPAGKATLTAEVRLTVKGQVEELATRRYTVTVR